MRDDNRQHDVRDIEEIDTAVRELEHAVFGVGSRPGLTQEVGRLGIVIDGDARRDVKGLRPRVTSNEEFVEEMKDLRIWVKGIVVGLGFNFIASLVTLIALWSKLVH